MLGGARNKPDSIQKYSLFILTTMYCTNIFRLKIRMKQYIDIIITEWLITIEEYHVILYTFNYQFRYTYVIAPTLKTLTHLDT